MSLHCQQTIRIDQKALKDIEKEVGEMPENQSLNGILFFDSLKKWFGLKINKKNECTLRIKKKILRLLQNDYVSIFAAPWRGSSAG